jgi:Fur family zinc uptake transcriptional regulator
MAHETHSAKDSAVAERLSLAEELCAQRGSRLTPLRRRVLETLLRHPGSLKAYELLDALRPTQPNAAPPTVYRALEFLSAQGLIHRLDALNAWSACTDAGGHPHDVLAVCTRCGNVAELSDPSLSARLAQCIAQAGYVLDGHVTELKALCPRCQQA